MMMFGADPMPPLLWLHLCLRRGTNSRMASSSLQGCLQNMRGIFFFLFSMILEKYPPVIIGKKGDCQPKPPFRFSKCPVICRGEVPLDKLTSEVTRNLLLYKGMLSLLEKRKDLYTCERERSYYAYKRGKMVDGIIIPSF
jgi:hypothetical protein